MSCFWLSCSCWAWGGSGGRENSVCSLSRRRHSSSRSHLCSKSVGASFLHAHKGVASFQKRCLYGMLTCKAPPWKH